jgi:hypothetical protein
VRYFYRLVAMKQGIVRGFDFPATTKRQNGQQAHNQMASDDGRTQRQDVRGWISVGRPPGTAGKAGPKFHETA